jgi:hypothetical protein
MAAGGSGLAGTRAGIRSGRPRRGRGGWRESRKGGVSGDLGFGRHVMDELGSGSHVRASADPCSGREGETAPTEI